MILRTAEMVGLIGKGKGAKFANFTYKKEDGEIARYQLILGVDFETLYKKDVATLTELIPTIDKATEPTLYEAAMAILSSRQESLTVGIGNNSRYTCKDTYVQLETIKGIKVHKEDGILYVMGLVQSKQVLQEGEPKKPVKSRPLTLAKKEVEKLLPSNRIRQFTIKRVNRIAANGEIIEIEQEEE